MRLISLSLFFIFNWLSSQEYHQISQEDVLKNVQNNNQNLKIVQKEIQLAQTDYKQSNAIFLPQVTFSYTGTITTNPLMAFGSKLNQEILTQADFNPTLLNNPEQTQNFATKIEIQQPLINVDGFLKRQASKTKVEAIHLKQERTKQYLKFEAYKTYMQLQLAHKAVKVLEKALKTGEANQRLAQNVYNQGYMQKSDLLLVEVHLTDIKNKLFSAKSNVKNISNYLSLLMNKNENITYQPIDELTTEELVVENISLPINRSDIKAKALTTEIYTKMYKAEKMSFFPRLNAFGNYQFYDKHFLQANATGYLLGLQLSWDIFKGGQRLKKIEKTKIELEKSKLEYEQYKAKSNLELNKAKRMLTDAENKLKLTELSVKQSEEALRIRKNRFKAGLEKSTNLLESETQYAQKQLEYYQTVYQYNYTKAYLEFLAP